MGYFFKGVGLKGIIEWLKKNPETAEVMKKTIKSPLASEPGLANPSLHSEGGRTLRKSLDSVSSP